jgi:hypothetical protein
MKKMILAAAALAAVAAATPAAAQSAAVAASPRAVANARLIKPLQLEALRDLNFGTIVMGTIIGNQTVSIDAAGTVSCGASGGGLTCVDSPVPTSALYRVRGTQGQVVVVSVGATSLAGPGSASLAFTPIALTGLTLQNSGSVGDEFGVGGSITINSSTVDGVYAGEIDVRVAYQ